MLLKVYELINKLQSEIGDDAEVRLSVNDDCLEIRVDWWKQDFHVIRQYRELQLGMMFDESKELSSFLVWCKKEYAQAYTMTTK